MEPRFIPAHSFEFSVPKPIRLPSWVRSRPKVNQRADKVMAPGIGGLQ
jgi:hypothetical protein